MTNREKLGNYKLEIAPIPEEDGGGYQALYPVLARTIVGYGETPPAALADLLASLDLLLSSLEESNETLPTPEPRTEWQEFSGRVTLRLPKSLHYRLDRLKDAEGVSLNGLITDMLQSGATALESGLTFGAVRGQANPLAELWQEVGEARNFSIRKSLSEEFGSPLHTTSELFDPVRYDEFCNEDFKRLEA